MAEMSYKDFKRLAAEYRALCHERQYNQTPEIEQMLKTVEAACEGWLATVPDAIARTDLRLKYMDGYSWNEIAKHQSCYATKQAVFRRAAYWANKAGK